MITFKEFFNRREQMPISGRMNSTKLPSGLPVVKDYSKEFKYPGNPVSSKISSPKAILPSEIGLRPSDRSIAKKPSDFLKRGSI